MQQRQLVAESKESYDNRAEKTSRRTGIWVLRAGKRAVRARTKPRDDIFTQEWKPGVYRPRSIMGAKAYTEPTAAKSRTRRPRRHSSAPSLPTIAPYPLLIHNTLALFLLLSSCFLPRNMDTPAKTSTISPRKSASPGLTVRTGRERSSSIVKVEKVGEESQADVLDQSVYENLNAEWVNRKGTSTTM